MVKCALILAVLGSLHICDAFKILAVFPMPSPSHSILGDGYVKLLLEAGHEITYITPYPKKQKAHPNLHLIDVSDLQKLSPSNLVSLKRVVDNEISLSEYAGFFSVLSSIAESTINHENVQNLIKDTSQQFNLVILQFIFTDVLSGFSAFYNCPFIWAISFAPDSMLLGMIHEQNNPAFYPSAMSADIPPLSFAQRAKGLLAAGLISAFKHFSSRTSYLETCIGYVEVKREINKCTVRSKVVPEHRIRDKAYCVTISINEKEEEIIDVECDGCAAALGGCKHALVALFWLSKKTEEPASTSVECYWKKPRLLDARAQHVEIRHIFKNAKVIELEPKNRNILEQFQQECKNRKITDALITCFQNENESIDRYNLFNLMLKFIEEEVDHSFVNFKEYIDLKISQEIMEEISTRTVNQTEARLWHNLRQGRITASKLYDAAHCKVDGTLVQQIFGGYKVPETAAIKRGKSLENAVIKEIERKLKKKIERCGFILINGLIGASPDGVCEDFVVEVKCPTSVKTFKNYVQNKKIKPKFKGQICCQMLAANKSRGLFCVADPSFETNKKIYLYWINIDKDFVEDLIKKSMDFWEKYVFPKLMTSAKS